MEGGELDVHQLLGVERAVPVAADGHRLGQQHSGRVDGLEDALLVHPPRDLLDEHWGHSLGPQLLMDAEEVNLHHELLAAHTNPQTFDHTNTQTCEHANTQQNKCRHDCRL